MEYILPFYVFRLYIPVHILWFEYTKWFAVAQQIIKRAVEGTLNPFSFQGCDLWEIMCEVLACNRNDTEAWISGSAHCYK